MTGKKVDIETLEETMGEVVEALAIAEQAAEFIQTSSADPAHRGRAALVLRQAEAMLDVVGRVIDGQVANGLLSDYEEPSDAQSPLHAIRLPTATIH